MKIIIFGCGKVYCRKKQSIPEYVRIMGIMDNRKELHGKKIDGIAVFGPQDGKQYDYDWIVLMSEAAVEMREQLLQLDYDSTKILHYSDFFGMLPLQIQRYSGVEKTENPDRKRLLIVSVPLIFNGVPVISLTTGKSAAQMGYSVTIAAEDGDGRYIREATENGIEILLCSDLGSASLANLSWTDAYDVILINSLPMIRLAEKLSRKREIIVWLHESPAEYKRIVYWRKEISDGICRKTMRIYAVSQRARKHFTENFIVDRKIPVFQLGICDQRQKVDASDCLFSYGLVGGFARIKGQDIFLSAVEKFPEDILEKIFFFLVGRRETNEYTQNIIKRASLINNCILLGERTRREIYDVYRRLRVIVIASRAETVSIVAIEAMMMGKVCIVSNETGIAAYIEQGKNGFVFPNEDVEKLYKQMLWCYQHQEQLDEIGKNARKTYETCFSADIFKDNLRKVLCP